MKIDKKNFNLLVKKYQEGILNKKEENKLFQDILKLIKRILWKKFSLNDEDIVSFVMEKIQVSLRKHFS